MAASGIRGLMKLDPVTLNEMTSFMTGESIETAGDHISPAISVNFLFFQSKS